MARTPIRLKSGSTYKRPTIFFLAIRSVEHSDQKTGTFSQGKYLLLWLPFAFLANKSLSRVKKPCFVLDVTSGSIKNATQELLVKSTGTLFDLVTTFRGNVNLVPLPNFESTRNEGNCYEDLAKQQHYF